MNEPKPFASLSPSLLARKGGARPAMRSQLQPMQQFHANAARQIEDDLGWNDMGYDHTGHDAPAPAPLPAAKADVVTLKPSASLAPPPIPQSPVVAKVPEVVRQQEAIAERVAEVAQPKPAAPKSAAPKAPVAKAPKLADVTRRSALSDGRRAAFTLRLDAERHLKLRLACTIANRSAQQIVTDALDQFIADLPEVAALAAQVKKRG